MAVGDDDFGRRYPDAARITVDASRPSRLTGSFPPAPRRRRLAMADLLIAHARSTTGTDGNAYAEAGFRSPDEYWADATSEPMEVSKFVHRLVIHFLTPSEDGDYYKRDLEVALHTAAVNGESWFIEVPGKECKLRPRDAAQWLLSMPKREHLVPVGLRAFLEDSQTSATADPAPIVAAKSRRKGKRPKSDAIIARMRTMDPDKLTELREKQLAAEFGASRDTCRKARDEVLSTKSRSTKTTNDS